jgi:hypothetical protein
MVPTKNIFVLSLVALLTATAVAASPLDSDILDIGDIAKPAADLVSSPTDVTDSAEPVEPAVDVVAPVVDAVKPVADEVEPIVDTIEPVVKPIKPAKPDVEKPIVEITEPIVEEPIVEVEKPIVEEPIVEAVKPLVNTKKSEPTVNTQTVNTVIPDVDEEEDPIVDTKGSEDLAPVTTPPVVPATAPIEFKPAEEEDLSLDDIVDSILITKAPSEAAAEPAKEAVKDVISESLSEETRGDPETVVEGLQVETERTPDPDEKIVAIVVDPIENSLLGPSYTATRVPSH